MHMYVGTIWIVLILLFIGRKKSIALTGLMAAVCYGLLYLCLGKCVCTCTYFSMCLNTYCTVKP